ncbi:hypothetical protein VHEMI02814 [[Torrubiella] hemipterigena]|uniref:Bulb-type lectin domain-containing protein n=1 Tax=[Torrubiella] hemipterigena TaxID=1531966 RepID=A0A0A1SWU5_9HYPO|nr:hypothetical protein VHEMI02814 [[Torrubiella] hemipterigena]
MRFFSLVLLASSIGVGCAAPDVKSRCNWPGWTLIDSNPDTDHVALDGDKIYQYRRNTGQILRYNDGNATWTLLDEDKANDSIDAGGGCLAKITNKGEISAFPGPNNTWRKMTGPAAAGNHPYFIANADGLYVIQKEGSIWFWNGFDYILKDFWKSNCGFFGRLIVRDDDGTAWRYVGPGVKWEQIDSSGQVFGIAADPVTETNIIQKRPDRNVYLYGGAPNKWTLIDDKKNTRDAQIGPSGTYVVKDDAGIWQYTGTPLTGWKQIDGNPNTSRIFAGGRYLIQLHEDGKLWIYKP